MIRRSWEYTDGDTGVLYAFLSDNEVREVLKLYTGMRVMIRERNRGEVILNGGTLPEDTRFEVRLR
jgi:hypothetical protein